MSCEAFQKFFLHVVNKENYFVYYARCLVTSIYIHLKKYVNINYPFNYVEGKSAYKQINVITDFCVVVIGDIEHIIHKLHNFIFIKFSILFVWL